MSFTLPLAGSNIFEEFDRNDVLNPVFIENQRSTSTERVQIIRDLAIQTLNDCALAASQEMACGQISSIIANLQRICPLELWLKGDDILSIQRSEKKALSKIKNLLATQKTNLIQCAQSHLNKIPENGSEKESDWTLYLAFLNDNNPDQDFALDTDQALTITPILDFHSLEKTRAEKTKMVLIIQRLILKTLQYFQERQQTLVVAKAIETLQNAFRQMPHQLEGQNASSLRESAKKALLPITHLLTDNHRLRAAINAHADDQCQTRLAEAEQKEWTVLHGYIKFIEDNLEAFQRSVEKLPGQQEASNNKKRKTPPTNINPPAKAPWGAARTEQIRIEADLKEALMFRDFTLQILKWLKDIPGTEATSIDQAIKRIEGKEIASITQAKEALGEIKNIFVEFPGLDDLILRKAQRIIEKNTFDDEAESANWNLYLAKLTTLREEAKKIPPALQSLIFDALQSLVPGALEILNEADAWRSKIPLVIKEMQENFDSNSHLLGFLPFILSRMSRLIEKRFFLAEAVKAYCLKSIEEEDYTNKEEKTLLYQYMKPLFERETERENQAKKVLSVKQSIFNTLEALQKMVPTQKILNTIESLKENFELLELVRKDKGLPNLDGRDISSIQKSARDALSPIKNLLASEHAIGAAIAAYVTDQYFKNLTKNPREEEWGLCRDYLYSLESDLPHFRTVLDESLRRSILDASLGRSQQGALLSTPAIDQPLARRSDSHLLSALALKQFIVKALDTLDPSIDWGINPQDAIYKINAFFEADKNPPTPALSLVIMRLLMCQRPRLAKALQDYFIAEAERVDKKTRAWLQSQFIDPLFKETRTQELTDKEKELATFFNRIE